MICPTCGYQNSPREKFCQQCGLFCPKLVVRNYQ
ncbi:zinc-ribbon domain-containing protein [Ligilactobacillus animalis]